jgi:hypothetical protein
MAITHDDYRRARYICEAAAKNLEEAMYPDNRGGRSLNPLIFLVGLFLTMDKYNAQHLTKVHDVLTRDLPRKDQWDLGVLRVGDTGEVKILTVNDLYQLSKRITRQLDFTRARADHLSKANRHKRREHIDNFIYDILKPTLPPRPEGSEDYALDGTGIRASEKGKSSQQVDFPIDIVHDEIKEESEYQGNQELFAVPGNIERDAKGKELPGRGRRGASDAHWSVKTATSGGLEKYFGYDAETICRVPKIRLEKGEVRSEPNLIESLVVIPGAADIVNPCLRMIDRMSARGLPVRSLLVDRHYSYKDFTRWAIELIRRDISQVADMHKNDQNFKDWDGMKIAAGWAHCPCAPERLGEIPTLSPTASDEERAIFIANIAERQAYAAKKVSPLSVDGKIRFSCPALNGTIGCPLRDGTVATALSLGLPVIENPPDEIGRPAICTQQTVQLHVKTKEQKIAMKMSQKHYWGSKAWMLNYRRRTYIEGCFGVFKSATGTGHDRGSHQFQGMPLVTIAIAVSAAATNMRLLRSWHEQTALGDPEHQLLIPDAEFFGLKELTQTSARLIDQAARKTAA